jgi:hypothetical protein
MAIADWMKRAVSPEAVMADVKPGAHVFLHGGCAPAFALETALAGRLGELPDVTVYQMHKEGPEAILNVPWAAGVRVCLHGPARARAQERPQRRRRARRDHGGRSDDQSKYGCSCVGLRVSEEEVVGA